MTPALTDMRFRRLTYRVRPPRLAVLVPFYASSLRTCGTWQLRMQGVLEVLSHTEAGSGAIILPVGEQGLSSVFVSLLRVFDPDSIVSYVPSVRERSTGEQPAMQTRSPAEGAPSRAARAERLSTSSDVLRDVALRLSQACSAFVFDGVLPTVEADMVPPFPMRGVWKGQAPLFVVGDGDLDPRIRLAAAGRVGLLSPSYEEALSKPRSLVIRVPASSENTEEWLALAWRRQLEGAPVPIVGGFGPAYSLDRLVNRDTVASLSEVPDTPFAASAAGWAWNFALSARIFRPAPVFVLGDSPEDYCLAFTLDRLFRNGAWLPCGADLEELDQVKSGLSKKVSSTMLGLEPAPYLTSVSLGMDAVLRCAESIRHRLGHERKVIQLAPDKLPVAGWTPCRLLDPEIVDHVRFEPFVGDCQATTFDTPLPSWLPDNPFDRSWEVDVLVDNRRLPTRSCLNELLLAPASFQPAAVRSSSDGTSYSPVPILQLDGVAPERQFARPSLRVPPVAEVFGALLADSGLSLFDSSTGNYTRESIALWGGLENLAADLVDGDSWAILKAFCRKPAKGRGAASPQVGRASRTSGMIYLSIEDCLGVVKAAGSGFSVDDERISALVDRYLESSILRRGFVLRCSRCRSEDWYDLEDIGHTFTCVRCRAVATITKPAWARRMDWRAETDSEPRCYYRLNEVVRQALMHNVQAPVLALTRLAEEAIAFDFLTEMEVRREEETFAEVDLWCVADGALVIGEASSTGVLSPRRDDQVLRLEKLATIATAMKVDRFVLASTASRWNGETRKAATTAFRDLELELVFIEGLGKR